jgi:hypothetical protein
MIKFSDDIRYISIQHNEIEGDFYLEIGQCDNEENSNGITLTKKEFMELMSSMDELHRREILK